MSDHAPLDDIVLEADRLLEAAAAEDVPVRLVGGLAVRMHAGGEPVIARVYKDIDLVTLKGRGKRVSEFMTGMGYEGDRAFNATNGHRRLLYYDPPHARQVDVFVGAFSMCHKVPLDGRIEVDAVSIPLAELLLTKLQVVELNEKDVRDALALLHDHAVGDEDGDLVNVSRVAELCAADWGLCRTVTQNLISCRAFAQTYDVPDSERLDERLETLLARIDAEPKSRGWRMRAKIGDRKRWYELPEEVAGGP